MGEANNAIRIFSNPASRMAPQPAPITTAPIKPPIRACEELLGKPRYHVSRFQTIALVNAANKTASLMAPAITTSSPMVLATATPKMKGPKNSASAVIPNARRGESARDEIMVATTLLESWMPFKKSNRNARPMTTIMMVDMGAATWSSQRCRR